jgi:hypothetical protein
LQSAIDDWPLSLSVVDLGDETADCFFSGGNRVSIDGSRRDCEVDVFNCGGCGFARVLESVIERDVYARPILLWVTAVESDELLASFDEPSSAADDDPVFRLTLVGSCRLGFAVTDDRLTGKFTFVCRSPVDFWADAPGVTFGAARDRDFLGDASPTDRADNGRSFGFSCRFQAFINEPTLRPF